MTNKRTFFVVSVLAMLTVFGARNIIAATELARVGSSVISLEEFNTKYKENLKFFQFKAPTKKSVLDDLINRELGIQEAKRAGLDKDPLVIDRMNTVLYHALLDKRLSKDFEGIHISDDEAKEFYGRNPEIRTSHIFVAVRADAPADQVKKAHEKIQKIQENNIKDIKDGKISFAEVAQRQSEGVAAPMGGDIDYQTRDKLDPAYYETAVNLKTPGKISGIIRSQFGYHIIKLTAIRPWEEVDKAQVKRLVFDERRTQIFEKYMGQLRQKSKITVQNDLIKE
jgi:peptidyl-prolyl cis-trans isomerase C/peptidyl-prolyl cis-trans isomerase D